MPEMCGILNQLKGGKAGIAAAKAGAGAATVQAAPVAMSALAFSHQVSKDTERNAGNVLTRYKGKQFTIDYEVDDTILGGLQMYTESEFMDMSLSSRLDRISSEVGKLGN
mgnify:CR=1 FL=1